MSHQRKHWLTVAAVATVLWGFTCDAYASHFRFAHNTWRVVSGNTVEFTSTQAWRAATLPGSELPIDFGDGSGTGIGPVTTIGTFTDLAAEQYTIIQYKVQHTYATPGPYTAFLASCCRIDSLLNASSASERVETVVDLRAGNTGSPVSSLPIIVQMGQGTINTIPIPIADPDGDTFTCRMATFAESEIPSVASAGIHTLSVSSGCVMTWNTAATTVGEKYAVQVVIEENHGGNISRVAIDFIIEIVAATGSPSCSGTSGLNIVNVGQAFVGNFTGTDPDGGNLTVSHLGLPPGATLTPVSGTTQAQPFNSTFNWTPLPSDAGTSHSVTIAYSDPGGLQGFCSFSINVPLVATVCGNNVKEAGEQCDGTDDVACPGACVAPSLPNECTCGSTTSTTNTTMTTTTTLASVCGNGVPEAGETCDPPNGEDCNNGIDDDGDGRIDCADKDLVPNGCANPANPSIGITTCGLNCQSDSACSKIIKDPALIRFGKDGAPDSLSVHGRFRIQSPVDPQFEGMVITLSNVNGPIYRARLMPDDMEGRQGGRRWSFKDRTARDNGVGVRDGLYSVLAKRISYQNEPYFVFRIKSYGDLSAATEALMTMQIAIGNDSAALEATWTATSSGWKLSQSDF